MNSPLAATAEISPETARRWSGIRNELERLKDFDHNVYTEVVALLERTDLLEADNEELRGKLDARHSFDGKQ